MHYDNLNVADCISELYFIEMVKTVGLSITKVGTIFIKKNGVVSAGLIKTSPEAQAIRCSVYGLTEHMQKFKLQNKTIEACNMHRSCKYHGI